IVSLLLVAILLWRQSALGEPDARADNADALAAYSERVPFDVEPRLALRARARRCRRVQQRRRLPGRARGRARGARRRLRALASAGRGARVACARVRA